MIKIFLLVFINFLKLRPIKQNALNLINIISSDQDDVFLPSLASLNIQYSSLSKSLPGILVGSLHDEKSEHLGQPLAKPISKLEAHNRG